MAFEKGDVKINGLNYRIDLTSYRCKDVVDFSPRASTPGGSIIHSDLMLYQPLLQTDWRHGFGFHWYEDAMGYMRTEGNVDTRQNGIVSLFTAAVSSDTNATNKKGGIVHGSNFYAWGTGGIRVFNGTTWADVTYTPSSGVVNTMFSNGENLFAAPNDARIRKMVGSTWSDAGVDTDATDYGWILLHNGKVYAGKHATNIVHYGTTADLSDLHGSTTSDTAEIVVGVGSIPVKRAITYASFLYFARQDGLWSLGDDNIARKVLDFSGSVSTDNFRSMAVSNGYLTFPIQDVVYQWNGSRLNNITPQRINDEFPYKTYGRFDNFVAAHDFLYCTARTNETSYTEALLCYDGVGWHKLCDLVTAGAGTTTMLAYDSNNTRLWYHVDNGVTSQVTSYIQLQTNSRYPYAAFPTTGTHSLISSRWDMGFRRVQKSMTSLLIEASNCSATQRLEIYYALDGGPWIQWGSVIESGFTELTMPGGLHSQEFNYAQIRVDFVTGTAAQSPILEGLTMRFIMRPNLALGWNFNLPASSGLVYGSFEDDRSAQTIWEDLLEARDSKAPVVFQDLDGIEYFTYITSMTSQAVENHVDTEEGGHRNVEKLINLNLVEAK